MTAPERNVKLFDRFMDWVDCHPRTGWYICVVATMNLALNLIDAFNFF
jgi:hypothetical protein